MPAGASRFAVGLTGGIGSGKSTVADLFAACGASIIDTDVIAHQLTGPSGDAMPAIRSAFGSSMIRQDGSLDRAAMRARVFSESDARQELERILHPMIRAHCDRQIQDAAGAYPMVVVPLLVETGNWRTRVARILVVDCEPDEQIRRVMQRNRLTREQVLSIIAAQASREERLAAADDTIFNGKGMDVATLSGEVNRLHARYLSLAAAVREENLQ